MLRHERTCGATGRKAAGPQDGRARRLQGAGLPGDTVSGGVSGLPGPVRGLVVETVPQMTLKTWHLPFKAGGDTEPRWTVEF